MHPFGNTICVVQLSGANILAMLNASVAKLPGADGGFPAVSGMRFRVKVSSPVGQRVQDLTVNGAPIDLQKTYTVAMPNYVLDGGDGYAGVKNNAVVLVNAEQGELMVSALERYIAGREISPKVDGRISIEP